MSIVTEVFADTGEVVERPMTPEELAQRKADEKAAAEAAKAAEAEAAAKAAARAAVLERLGITEDEAALLRDAL